MTPSIDTIKRLTAAEFGVSVRDLESARRDRPTLRARWTAMLLARRYTSHSSPVIGRAFGDRDHTTVLHAVDRAPFLIAMGLIDADKVARVERMLAPLGDVA